MLWPPGQGTCAAAFTEKRWQEESFCRSLAGAKSYYGGIFQNPNLHPKCRHRMQSQKADYAPPTQTHVRARQAVVGGQRQWLNMPACVSVHGRCTPTKTASLGVLFSRSAGSSSCRRWHCRKSLAPPVPGLPPPLCCPLPASLSLLERRLPDSPPEGGPYLLGRNEALHVEVESKVDHVEHSMAPQGGGKPFVEPAEPQPVRLDDLPGSGEGGRLLREQSKTRECAPWRDMAEERKPPPDFEMCRAAKPFIWADNDE